MLWKVKLNVSFYILKQNEVWKVYYQFNHFDLYQKSYSILS